MYLKQKKCKHDLMNSGLLRISLCRPLSLYLLIFCPSKRARVWNFKATQTWFIDFLQNSLTVWCAPRCCITMIWRTRSSTRCTGTTLCRRPMARCPARVSMVRFWVERFCPIPICQKNTFYFIDFYRRRPLNDRRRAEIARREDKKWYSDIGL